METLPIDNRTRKTLIAVIVGMMAIVTAILISISLKLNIVQNLVMGWIITTFYALFSFFLIDPVVQMYPVREVEKKVYQDRIKIVEKPVIEEIQIPVENRTVEVIDREVIKEVEKQVIEEIQIPVENRTVEVIDRPVAIQIPVENRTVEVIDRIVYRTKRKKKKLNIPKFKFIGSTQTKTYHKRNCKFSKMLKNKYKLHSNSKAFFKKKHFKACKVCIKKKK